MDIKSKVRQYLALKDEATLLTKRTNQIKEELLLEVEAAEFDDRGHKKLVIEDEYKGEVTLTKQRRVSKSLDMQVAEDILTSKGIKDKCIKMVPTLDEASIMSAFYEGLLTEADIDAMFPAKVTYAFLVDAKWKTFKLVTGAMAQVNYLQMKFAHALVVIVIAGLASNVWRLYWINV